MYKMFNYFTSATRNMLLKLNIENYMRIKFYSLYKTFRSGDVFASSHSGCPHYRARALHTCGIVF